MEEIEDIVTPNFTIHLNENFKLSRFLLLTSLSIT